VFWAKKAKATGILNISSDELHSFCIYGFFAAMKRSLHCQLLAFQSDFVGESEQTLVMSRNMVMSSQILPVGEQAEATNTTLYIIQWLPITSAIAASAH
jgi:hypothetical protein